MPEVPAELHSKRDQHLFGPGPKRLLALDGGGVRGAISVAFLEHIEHLVWERKGREIRLGDWFDLIGGTSTGAIIAGALALGHTTRELEQFYRQRAHLVFRSSLRIPGLQARFNAKTLSAEIERVVGDKTLDDPELITGFALMAKRMDTGSPWLISNNPRAPYWDARPGRTAIPNRKYRLANLVRASTAAPFYFDPELISIHENEPSGLFIDGGVTPYNDPGLILFLMVTLKAYGICWSLGLKNLTIVSIGTGSYRRRVKPEHLGFMQPISLAYQALSSLIDDTQSQSLMLMQLLGKSLVPWSINREVGTLAGEKGGRLFKFVRYDVRLERDWLDANYEGTISDEELVALREMSRPEIIPLAYEIGRQAAKKQVRPEHIGLDT
jgi:Patatin-like phospholipase